MQLVRQFRRLLIYQRQFVRAKGDLSLEPNWVQKMAKKRMKRLQVISLNETFLDPGSHAGEEAGTPNERNTIEGDIKESDAEQIYTPVNPSEISKYKSLLYSGLERQPEFIKLSELWYFYSKLQPRPKLSSKQLTIFTSLIANSCVWVANIKRKRLKILLNGYPITIDCWHSIAKTKEIDNLEMANVMLKELKSNGLEATAVTFNIIMERLFSSNSSDAIKLFGIIPAEFKTPKIYYFAIMTHVNLNNIKEAIDLLSKFNEKDYSLYHTVLKTIYNQPHFETKQYDRLVLLMECLELSSPGIYFTQYLILLKFKRSKTEFELLRNLMAKESTDRAFSESNCEITRMLDDGNIRGATLKFKVELKKRVSIIPNFIYDKMIQLAVQKDDNGLAQTSLMRQREEGLAASNRTYLDLMSAFANTGNSDRVESLIKQVFRRGLPLQAEHYYHLVDAHCQNGSVIFAREDLKSMVSNGIKPNAAIYTRIIKCFLEQKNPTPNPNFDKAKLFLQEMVQGVNIAPTDELLGLFVKSFHLIPERIFKNTDSWYRLLKEMSVHENVIVLDHMMEVALMEIPVELNPNLVSDISFKYFFTLFQNSKIKLIPTAKSYENRILWSIRNEKVEDVMVQWERLLGDKMVPTFKTCQLMLQLMKDDMLKMSQIWESIISKGGVTQELVIVYIDILLEMEMPSQVVEAMMRNKALGIELPHEYIWQVKKTFEEKGWVEVKELTAFFLKTQPMAAKPWLIELPGTLKELQGMQTKLKNLEKRSRLELLVRIREQVVRYNR